MSDKVPLHVYEKAKKREKLLDKFATGMKRVGIVLFVLVILGLVVFIIGASWVQGWGWAPLLFFAGVVILGVWAGLADHNERILKRARENGVVDE